MPAVKEEEGDEMGENREEICHHNVATRVFVEQEGWLRIPSARSAPIEKIFLCVSNPGVPHYFIPPRWSENGRESCLCVSCPDLSMVFYNTSGSQEDSKNRTYVSYTI